jgi:hypothetical protein
MPGSRPGSPGAAGGRSRPLMRPFAMVSLMSHRRRRVFVDTPKGRRSAGFTVPESAEAVDVSMALRQAGLVAVRAAPRP